MNSPSRPPPALPAADTPSLQSLGLDAAAEALYRALLVQPNAPAATLAQALGAAPAATEAGLQALQARGLAAPSRQPAGGWVATAPEVAVELLLMERQADLNQARAALPELLRGLMRASGEADTQDVQVVPGDAPSQLRAYLELHHAARDVVASIVCPPFVASAPDAMEAARAQARQRGVRLRMLMAPEVLQWPGWTSAARQAVAAGDDIRVADDLPFKMLLCDRSFGLVPLRREAPDGAALRLGHTPVLDALWLMFDTLWARGVPALGAETAPAAEAGEAELRALLTLLAAGTNDKKIASILGISERTLLRRINALSAELQARSRFHCGWLAARRFGTGV